MIIPIKWLKDYIEISKSNSEIAASFTSLGLLLDKPITHNILNLEHRMDRSDWLSIIGCARDLAAFENLKLKYPKKHTKPGKKSNTNTLVPITVTARKVVNRFNTRVFTNLKVKDSPNWLKQRLNAYGIPTVNNIVDITNFVMVEYGQPMHAQDLDKFSKREIVLRYAKKNESIKTLLGKKVKLDPKTLILSQDDTPIVIGGIVGGTITSVNNHTTQIILDAGNYNQRSIRETSRRLKIQNETVLRYDKFLHPQLTQIALERASHLILELAGGQYYENIDWYPHPIKPQTMTLRPSRVKLLSGMNISLTTIKSILKHLEYQIIDESKSKLTIEIPYFRTDISVEDDLVADILRMSDYTLIPTVMMPQVPPAELTSKLYKLEDQIRDILTGIGLHEHITDPLVKTTGNKTQVVLENALTSDKSALRETVISTLRHELITYSKHNISPASLFEIGLSYHKLPKNKGIAKYSESRELAIAYSNKNTTPNSQSLELRSIIATLLDSLGINHLNYSVDKNIGYIKKNNKTIATYSHQEATFAIDALINYVNFANFTITSFTNYQTADLSLNVPIGIQFGQVMKTLTRSNEDLINIQLLEEGRVKSSKNHNSILVRLKIKETANLAKVIAQAESILSKKYAISTKK